MNNEVEIRETLAIILSDLKKLIKHFRLDRRKPSEDETPAHQEPAQANETLRQIALAVNEISGHRTFTQEQYQQMEEIIIAAGRYFSKDQQDGNKRLQPLLETILTELQERTTERHESTVRHEHSFVVDFHNSKATLTIISLSVAVMVSVSLNAHQADRNKSLRDTDLKYRYVKMQGEATSKELYHLENLFTFDRNKDSIKIIRRQVEHYEQLVKEYNERQLQIRLNNERARQIKQEAASVKGK